MEKTGSSTSRKPASDKGQAVEMSKDNSTALSEDELKQVSGGTTKPAAGWNQVTNRSV